MLSILTVAAPDAAAIRADMPLLAYPPALAVFLTAMLLCVGVQANVVRSRLALAGIAISAVLLVVGLFEFREWPFWGASVALLSPLLIEAVALVGPKVRFTQKR